MKDITSFINEKYLIDIDTNTEAFEKFNKKWYDKCHNLSISGTFRWTEPRLNINDFSGFLDDFDKAYEPSSGTSYSDKLCQARYECYKAIRNGEINKVKEIASENGIEHFTYGASPAAAHVFGSNFLDCAMIFATYEYILNGKATIQMSIMNSICRFDDRFDWYNYFNENVKRLYNSLNK